MAARIALLVLFLGACGAASAGETYVTKKKIEPAHFDALVETLDGEMRAGGRFEHVSLAERARIHAAVSRMRQVLHGRQSIDELREHERVAVFNAQEEINGILTRRDGERLVCERRPLPGSHRKETVCETYAERMARQRGSRQRANELNRRIQQCNESGVCVSG